MKACVGILIALLVLLNAWQYRDRQKIRDTARQARLTVEATAASLHDQNTSLKAEKRVLAKKVALLEEAASATADVEPGEHTGRSPLEGLSEAMENPAMREIVAAQQKATLDAQYRGLYEHLGLEGEELEHFQKLITDAQMVTMENGMKLIGADVSPEERQQLVETMAAAQEDLKARVKEFLNDDADFEFYNYYTDTLGERLAMQGLRSTLDSSGQPLEKDTEEALVRLMYDERQNIGFEDHYYDQNRFDPSTITQAKIDRFMAQYDELQSKLAASAGTILDREQLEAFRENQKSSRSLQEMGLGMLFRTFNEQQP